MRGTHPTIEAATEAAKRAALSAQSQMYVIGGDPTDGSFAVIPWHMSERADAYMIVDPLGYAFEGPKAQELPIGFTGALPH